VTEALDAALAEIGQQDSAFVTGAARRFFKRSEW